jgi:hypothetical protein
MWMKIKISGIEPINVELSDFKFSLFNYQDTKPLLYFTMTYEEALRLKKELEAVLHDKPQVNVVRANYPVTLRQNEPSPNIVKSIMSKFTHDPAKTRSVELQKKIDAIDKTPVVVEKTEAEKESEAFWNSM